MEACPDEEILVVIDDENVYGQNFFVCYTTEVKEHELAKYATAVSASPDGAVVGEEGAAVEEEKEDEVPPPFKQSTPLLRTELHFCHRFRANYCRLVPGRVKAAKCNSIL